MGWTRDYVFVVFQDVVRHVWRNADFVLPHAFMGAEEPAEPVLASISYAGRPQAIGDSLLRRAERYTLRVADALLSKTDDQIRKVLIHEAVHMGYPGHGRDFRRMVIEKGGVVSGAGIDSGGVIKAQMKMGARYHTVKTFEPHEEVEAERWVREQLYAAKTGGQVQSWRLQFGGE